jgi:hypothetical protein
MFIPLEVRVDYVVVHVVREAFVEVHGRALLEAQLSFYEDPRVHRPDVVGDDGPDGHMGEYVPSQDYPGGDLDDLEPLFDELEDAPLGYIVDGLAPGLAYFPEKVTCPTLSTSKLVSGSSILRLPFSIATRECEAKVPRTTIGKGAVGTFNEEHTLRQGPTILSYFVLALCLVLSCLMRQVSAWPNINSPSAMAAAAGATCSVPSAVTFW